jgi:peroxiredoxin Q/BCP
VRRKRLWLAVTLGVCVATVGGLVMRERTGLLREGDVAPDFAVRLSTGESFRLSQYRGVKNVVLFFYPKDFTAGCTRQVCSYRDRLDEITSLNAIVIGISKDSEVSHRDFIEQHKLQYPLISDVDLSIARSYGVLRFGGLLPYSKRVTYIVDTTGVIRLAAWRDLSIDRDVDEVVHALQQLARRTSS